VRPKKSRLWRVLFVLALMLAVVLFGATVVVMNVLSAVRGPGVQGAPITVVVEEGATGRDVGDLLADMGLIEHEFLFRIALRLDESGATIKHGSHRVPRGAAALEILHILQRPPTPSLDTNLFKVTVPEGLTIRQIADLTPDPDAFLAAAANVSMPDEFGVDAPGPEGFLMPNTYYFDAPPEADVLLRRMIDQFKADYGAIEAEFPEAAEDPVRVLTIASLIEEEARVDDERALVSSVIHNRLEKGRALQMDSTLQYALNKYGQRLLNEDKEVDSPYNTYLYPGLPPGPISNPGVASIRAALAPADSDYLYFVSNADGKTHTFSKTMREHEAAVAKFRREIRQQRRELQQQQSAQE
jgi:UPF0755 protein